MHYIDSTLSKERKDVPSLPVNQKMELFCVWSAATAFDYRTHINIRQQKLWESFAIKVLLVVPILLTHIHPWFGFIATYKVGFVVGNYTMCLF